MECRLLKCNASYTTHSGMFNNGMHIATAVCLPWQFEEEFSKPEQQRATVEYVITVW